MALASSRTLSARRLPAVSSETDAEFPINRSCHTTAFHGARTADLVGHDFASPPTTPEADDSTILGLLHTADTQSPAIDLNTSYDPANIRHLAHLSSSKDSTALRALLHSRHKAHRTGLLHIPARNFRFDVQGAIISKRHPLPGAAHTVNALAIRKTLAWYFDVTFASACADFAAMMQCGPRAPDFPRGALGAVLHPRVLEMVGATVRGVEERDGEVVAPGAMREVVLRALVEWEEDEEVLGVAAVARDLAEVVALGVAGQRVCARVGPGERMLVLEFPQDGAVAKVLRH